MSLDNLIHPSFSIKSTINFHSVTNMQKIIILDTFDESGIRGYTQTRHNKIVNDKISWRQSMLIGRLRI
jgi:hypothetical protein